jgi:hypothetical protein
LKERKRWGEEKNGIQGEGEGDADDGEG